VKTMETRQDN